MSTSFLNRYKARSEPVLGFKIISSDGHTMSCQGDQWRLTPHSRRTSAKLIGLGRLDPRAVRRPGLGQSMDETNRPRSLARNLSTVWYPCSAISRSCRMSSASSRSAWTHQDGPYGAAGLVVVADDSRMGRSTHDRGEMAGRVVHPNGRVVVVLSKAANDDQATDKIHGDEQPRIDRYSFPSRIAL